MRVFIKGVASFFVAIMMVFSIYSSTVFASDENDMPENTTIATILTKGDNSFSVVEQKFIVDKNTDIRDYDNNKISFESFPVPCKAEIKSVLVNNYEFLCLNLQVKSILKRDSKKSD